MTTTTTNTLLARYQLQVLDLADPEAFDFEYLIPGILGEIGELFGQRAKAHWHGAPAEELRDLLIKEYGDVAWMCALLLHVCGVTAITRKPAATSMDPWYSLHGIGHEMYLYYSEDLSKYISVTAQIMWQRLEANAEYITGESFEHVLDTNIAKLQSRRARGVLKGAGDNR